MRAVVATRLPLPLLAISATCCAVFVAGGVAGCPAPGTNPGAKLDAGPGVAVEAPVALTGVSPRSTSNETAQPLLLFGRGFSAGMKLTLGAPFDLTMRLIVDDATHAHALLPPKEMPPAAVEVAAPLALVGADGNAIGEPLTLTMVNDAAFVDVTGFVSSREMTAVFTVSPFTDELIALDTTTGQVDRIPTLDGPWCLAAADIDGVESVVIGHRYSSTLLVVAMKPGADGKRTSKQLVGPAWANAIVVDNGVAYVGEHANDTLQAVDLTKNVVKWTAPVGPNPRGIAIVGDRIAVGSTVDGEVHFVAMKDGAVSKGIAPRPDIQILGGHTETYGQFVMGGKGVRALAYSPSSGMLFSGGAGPNTGPNPDHMGVQGTGGVGVIDPKTLTWPRHLGFNYGAPQAFALDDKRGRLYIADVAEGLVHVVDTKALVGKDVARARAAHLAAFPLPLPKDFLTFRPAADFGPGGVDLEAVNQPPTVGDFPKRRAGVEAHTGPSGLALSPDGKSLFVLERFTGRVTRLDVSKDTPVVVKSFPLFDPLVQADRRLGEIIYYTDFGRTGMSCDTCHLDGGPEGVFYTKTGMERIWRSPTVRGTRDTPPYFNPPAHPTLEDTVSYVGTNNRFRNLKLSPEEIMRLAVFTRGLTTMANPFRVPGEGGFQDTLKLGDGRVGHPKKGQAIFEGRCAGCHPAPLFSPDQDEKTRRRFMKISTPAALPLRENMQNLSFEHRTPPSLVGAWDVWPMLLSASAGFSVKDGDHLEATDRDPIRAVLERYSDRSHGDAMSLSPEARADVEAFVKSL